MLSLELCLLLFSLMDHHTSGPCECRGGTPRDQSVLLSYTVAVPMVAKIGPC